MDFMSDLVQRCIESGFMIHFRKKTNRLLGLHRLEHPQVFTADIEYIQWEDFKFVFMLCVFGMVLSLFIFLAEICYFKLREKIYSFFVSIHSTI